MTDDEIALVAFLREMIGFAAQRLLEDLVGRGAGHLSSPLSFSERVRTATSVRGATGAEGLVTVRECSRRNETRLHPA